MMRTHYVQELESVQQNLVQMGETTLALLAEAFERDGRSKAWSFSESPRA
jgi:hypothetical protein